MIRNTSEQLTCRDKVRFATKEGAEREARRYVPRAGCWLRAYRCAFCLGWHLGNSKRPKEEG